MDQIKIGKFIQEKRKEKGITQSELGEKMGVSYKSVSKWERGICMPDVSNFSMLCGELNVTLNELLSGEKNDDKEVINYIKNENKKHKKKLIISLILIIVLFLLSTLAILSLYFINNYNSYKVYKLHGESESFMYLNALFIETPEQLYFTNGVLYNLKEKDIRYMELYSKGNYLTTLNDIGGYTFETNNKEFQENKKDVNDWKIIIHYKENGEDKTEEIKLNNIKLISNKNIFYKKTDNKDDFKNIEELQESMYYMSDESKKLRTYLIEKGYTPLKRFNPETNEEMGYNERIYRKKVGNGTFTVLLSGFSPLISYSSDKFDMDMTPTYKSYMINNIRLNKHKNDDNDFTYSYNIQKDKGKCISGKCPDDMLQEARKFSESLKEEFEKVINFELESE